MKRLTIVFLIAFMFVVIQAHSFASSFFPTTDDLFGKTMPAISFAIGKQASTIENVDEGILETYTDFTDRNYQQFGRYSTGTGCTVSDWDTTNGVLTMHLSRGGASFTFQYDRVQGKATAFYPSSTRIEETMDSSYTETESLFPEINVAFGVGVPSMEAVFQREADSSTQLSDGTTELVFNDITIPDYKQMGQYWRSYEAVVTDNAVAGGVIKTTITINSQEISIEYGIDTRVLKLTYPEMYYINDNAFDASLKSQESILPDPDTIFGVFLPRIATALWRYADEREELENGGYTETYYNFSEDDYNTFSQYLLEQGCSVVDYKTTGNILAVYLEKDGGTFIFSYDSGKATGTVEYAPGARPEPEVSPSPSPTPTPAPATPKPAETKMYSESECWTIASNYFNGQSWKNPSSVTIHGHTSTWSEGGYLFMIDYSAQNGFGGYNRETYYIKVNASTGKVEYGASY